MPLTAPAGMETRPTSDLVKGAMFSALGDVGCEGRVLDLFAGSGGLGIEALSRGAEFCDFVEQAATACRAIRANLAKTRLEDRAAVHQQVVERFLAHAYGVYDLILIDPPYAIPDLHALTALIGGSAALGDATTLVLEHSSRRPPPPRAGALHCGKIRVHGDTAFSVYRADRGTKLT
ncbi:MAG: RsmD family RNA methyltransferase [Chloroflexota bacterium]